MNELDGVGRPVVTVFRGSNSVDWMLRPWVVAPLPSATPVHDSVFEKRMCTSEVTPGHIQCRSGCVP